MKRSRFLGATLFSVLFVPLLFVHGQPIESSKEARELFKKYTDKINLAKPPPPKEIIGTLQELEALGYEMHVVVPFRVEQLLIHPDPIVRRQAARTLAAIGANPFTAGARVDTLTRHLKDRDPEVLEALLLALIYIGPNAKEALPKVLELFKHDDPRIRRKAMVFFTGFLPENKDLMPTIIGALDDPDVGIDEKIPGYNSVSKLALIALIRYGPEAREVAPKLIQMVKDNKHGESYETALLSTLVRVKPDEPFTLNIFRDWLRAKNPEHIEKATGLFYRLGRHGKPAVPELIGALDMKPVADPSFERRIKTGILSALMWIGPDAKEALPAIRILANSQDFLVRQQVEKSIKAIEGTK